MKTTTGCSGSCPFITDQVGERGSSPALTREHALCALREHAWLIRWRVACALGRAPVRRAHRPVQRASGAVRLGEGGGVHDALLQEVEDFMQDSIVEFLVAVDRGHVPAAHPVIAAILKTISWRVVWRGTRLPARSLILGAGVGGDGSDNKPDPHEAQTVPDPEAVIDAARFLRANPDPPLMKDRNYYRAAVVARPTLMDFVSPIDRAAFELWLQGLPGHVIARRLNISQNTARQRIWRAKRAIDKALGDRDSLPKL